VSEAISSIGRINVSGSKRSLFFPVMATIMAALVFVAFSRTFYFRAITGVEGNIGTGPLPVQAIVHGVVASIWMLIFLSQPWLVYASRVRLHRRLGYAGVVTATALIVSGVITSIYFVPRGVGFSYPMDIITGIFFGNIFSLFIFAVFVSLAIRWRRESGSHKRMMYFATLSIIGPAFGFNERPVGPFLQQILPQAISPEIAFVLASVVALGIHDLMRAGRLRRTTVIGTVLLTVNFLLNSYLASHEGAQRFVMSLA
jgi:hypothetical protein